MHFVPRSNRLMNSLIRRKPLLLYGLTATLLIMLLMFWFMFFYAPLASKIECVQASIGTSKQQMHSMVDVKQEINKLQLSVEQLHAEWKKQQDTFAHYNPVTSVVESARRIGVELKRAELGNETTKNGYTTTPIIAHLQGTYESIVTCIEHVMQNYPLIDIQSLRMTRQGNNAQHYDAVCTWQIVAYGDEKKIVEKNSEPKKI